MPGFDYSRFDKLDVSDSEDEGGKNENFEDEVKQLSPDLPELTPDLQLVLAAKSGTKHIVEALLNGRASVNARDPHGRTALFQAVAGGSSNREIMELLIKRQADVVMRSEDGTTPLDQAACTEPADICQCLLELGGPCAEDRGLALVAASAAGKRSTTQMLLKSKASMCVARESDNRTALHFWAEQGDVELLASVLEARADVGAKDEKGMTPLACAVKGGHEASAQALCTHGSDANASASDGTRVIVEAAKLRSEPAALGALKVLLSFGANAEPPSPDSWMDTPLIAASCVGHTAVAEVLLASGAGADTSDGRGRRPLPCAAAVRRLDLCKLLLGSKAQVDGRSTSMEVGKAKGQSPATAGVTALSIAAAAGDAKLAGVLLEASADPNVTDERGIRPLMAAAGASGSTECGVLDLLAALVAARADVNSRQEGTGKTALVFAAGTGHVDACRALLDSRADPSLQTDAQAMALHAAAANGHKETCALLVDAGTAADAPGPGGKTAAELARASDYAELAAMLESSIG